jgi:hypothetical protein
MLQRAQMTQIGVDHGRHRLTGRLRHIRRLGFVEVAIVICCLGHGL